MKFALLMALALQAPAIVSSGPIDGLPIGVLPRQALPAKGCAAYLFTTGQTKALAAMATADPATLRLVLEGKTIDLSHAGAVTGGTFGFAPQTDYRDQTVSASLAMTVARRDDLREGAIVSQATLTIERQGADAVVVPLAGLIGCRSPT